MSNKFWFGFRRTAGLAACLFTLASSGCDKPPEEDPNLEQVQSIVAQCKYNLETGNYEEARNLGKQVINTSRFAAVENVAVDRARFCYTTANSLLQLNELTKNLKTLLQSVMGLVGGDEISLTPENIQRLALAYDEGRIEAQANSPISILFGSFSGPIEKTLRENQEQLEVIIRNKRFSWSLQHLNIQVGDAIIADAKGTYDMGEIYMLYGLTRQILGVFGLFKSQDYTVAFKPLIEYIVDVPDNPVLNLTTAPGKAVVNLIAVLMGTSPTFLSLDTALGKGIMQETGENFAVGFDATLNAITFMKNRKGDQTAHILEFLTRDDKDYLILHMELNNGANPIPLIDLQKFDGIAIPLDERVLEGLRNMSDDCANTPGVNTNLQRDVFPIVTLGLVVLAGSGAFDALIQLAMEGAEDAAKETATELIALLKDNQDLVFAALVSLVPVEVEFDFGHMFTSPGGLRQIFPAWTQPANTASMAAFTQATLVYSYECLAGNDPLLDNTYLCDDVSLDSDKGHFQDLDESPYFMWDPATGATFPSALVWKNYSATNNFGPVWGANAPAIADGIPSMFPYFGFKDGSFGKVLFLNMEAVDEKGLYKKGMQPATLTTLNATLATIFATVQGFL